MTKALFRDDAYLCEAEARVVALTQDGGVILDRSIFYATGGGQPGDSGRLSWEGGQCRIASCLKGEGDALICVPEAGETLPSAGMQVVQKLDWARRYGHMRIHTALHLLSVAIPFGVTGGSIGQDKGRLDFDMETPPEDKEAIAAKINQMIATNAPVVEAWITEEELDAQPELIKTMTVKPPRGSGRVRLIRIGDASPPLDLQPCGGTHVKTLQEIGKIRIGKVEKKGRMNRRIYLHLVD